MRIRLNNFYNFLLLCYGISIGVPDLRLSLSDISVRLDDILLLLFTLILILDKKKSRFSVNFTMATLYVCICAYFLMQFMNTVAHERQFSNYLVIRNFTMLFAMGVLLIFVRDKVSFSWLITGLSVGGLLFLVQVIFSLMNTNILNSPFYVVKSEIGFESLNANALGELAILFVIAIKLTFHFSDRHTGLRYFLIYLLVLVTLLSFNRAATIAFTIMFVTEIVAFGSIKLLIIILLILIGFVSLLQMFLFEYFALVLEALTFNPRTGGNTGSRFDVWGIAIDKIKEMPFWGFGHASEFFLFPDRNHVGSSHNFVLSIILENGFFIACIAVLVLIFLGVRIHRVGKRYPSSKSGAYMPSGYIALLSLNMFHSSLYGSKYALLSLLIFYLYTNFYSRRRG